MESKQCPFTITFYGALFGEVHTDHTPLLGGPPPLYSGYLYCPLQGDVLICMEMMDRSLHDLYKLVYDKLELRIPELVVGRMAESVSYSDRSVVSY